MSRALWNTACENCQKPIHVGDECALYEVTYCYFIHVHLICREEWLASIGLDREWLELREVTADRPLIHQVGGTWGRNPLGGSVCNRI